MPDPKIYAQVSLTEEEHNTLMILVRQAKKAIPGEEGVYYTMRATALESLATKLDTSVL